MRLMKDDSDGIFDELRNLKELQGTKPLIILNKMYFLTFCKFKVLQLELRDCLCNFKRPSFK